MKGEAHMPKVSVIIPIYNVEKFLTGCLESVVNQTLEDIEILCVDDGSTDDCPQIIKKFAENDKRIRVIHKENSGYGHSMNVGMDAASGEYVGIVESDDIILPEMYETLYHVAKEYDLDMVKSDCYLYWESRSHRSRIYVDDSKQYYNRVLDKNDREIYFRFWMFNWTGIYRKDFLKKNNIRHNETPGASFQDNGFWLQVMSMCERAMWIDKPFYLYRQDNPASSVKSRTKMMSTMTEYDFAGAILKKKGLEKEWELSNYYRMGECRAAFLRIDDSLKRAYLDVVKKEYLKYKDNIAVTGHWLYEYNLEWIRKAVSDPDGLCEDVINRKKKIVDRLEESKELIVYGAKAVAEAVLKRLYNMGYLENVRVAISKPEPDQHFFGFRVEAIEDVVKNCNSSDLVLLGVKQGTRAYGQMKETLEKLDFKNYMDTHEITDLFWAI